VAEEAAGAEGAGDRVRPDPADLIPEAHAVECVGRHCVDCGACLDVRPAWWNRAPLCLSCWDENRKNTRHGAAR
jgi:hypothetical protein